MPVTRVVASLMLLAWLTACGVQPQPNRYQISEPQYASAPVSELQREARIALERGDYQLAIDTLQRAIRIEPRDGWNWHYLGESYRRQGDFARCRAMAERAFGYAGQDQRLLQRNRRLEQMCGHG